ncbi:MAG TPA: AraC family transcriptional regulator [Pseudolabrys sp.]|nr:AraC family transcriptional regulator [Pseudolabrys sp.]
MTNNSHLLDLVTSKAPAEGLQSTAIDELTLVRHSRPTNPAHSLQRPALCIVVQGRKQVALGDSTYIYTPSHYLIASVAVPVLARVTQASTSQPYLCLRLALDPVVLAEMRMDSGPPADTSDEPPASGLNIGAMTPELIDAAARMMRLLDTPRDIPALAPLAIKEIYYRLLTGTLANTLRQVATAGSRLHQVSRAAAWIRNHYTQPVKIEKLAHIAGMSRSALHKHFKSVTEMSPLQYQKQMRLQEARKLLIADGINASEAGYRVGYTSATQFTREYSRMYGLPPARDAERLRSLQTAGIGNAGLAGVADG